MMRIIRLKGIPQRYPDGSLSGSKNGSSFEIHGGEVNISAAFNSS
jgi:hypothetical protein